jgi:SAM-dependent methyltransferase
VTETRSSWSTGTLGSVMVTPQAEQQRDYPRKEAYYESRGMPPALAARYYRLLGWSRRVLDLGCGTGDFGRFRPSDEYEIHGVDLDVGAIEIASAHEIAQVHDASAQRLPYSDGFFDGVLAKDILEHLLEPSRVVREIRRVMKPGGVVVASVVVAKPRRVWADYTHVRGFTRATARVLFEDNGFAVESIWPMGGIPLTTRFDLVDRVPQLLRFPLFDAVWTSSWELRATPR